MDLNSLIIFDKVAEHQSFSAAARALRLPKSNVSHKISQLEEDLGVRLFDRSTRRVRITDYGERIRGLTTSILDTANEIATIAEHAQRNPAGMIRISAPHDLGQTLIRDALPGFFANYPDVRVDLDFSNRFVNLIEEGYDLAIRASERTMKDSSFVFTRLASTSFHLYATARGPYNQIKSIADLLAAPIATYAGANVELRSGDEVQLLKSTARVKVNDMLSAKQVVLSNLAVGVLPDFIVHQELSEGRLMRILPQWSGHEASFFAVYPSRRLLPPRVRVFIDYLKSYFHELE